MYINPRFRSVPRSTNPITLSSFMPTFKQQPQQPLPPQQSNSNPKQRNDYRPVFLGKNSTGHQFLKDQGDVFVFGQGMSSEFPDFNSTTHFPSLVPSTSNTSASRKKTSIFPSLLSSSSRIEDREEGEVTPKSRDESMERRGERDRRNTRESSKRQLSPRGRNTSYQRDNKDSPERRGKGSTQKRSLSPSRNEKRSSSPRRRVSSPRKKANSSPIRLRRSSPSPQKRRLFPKKPNSPIPTRHRQSSPPSKKRRLSPQTSSSPKRKKLGSISPMEKGSFPKTYIALPRRNRKPASVASSSSFYSHRFPPTCETKVEKREVEKKSGKKRESGRKERKKSKGRSINPNLTIVVNNHKHRTVSNHATDEYVDTFLSNNKDLLPSTSKKSIGDVEKVSFPSIVSGNMNGRIDEEVGSRRDGKRKKISNEKNSSSTGSGANLIGVGSVVKRKIVSGNIDCMEGLAIFKGGDIGLKLDHIAKSVERIALPESNDFGNDLSISSSSAPNECVTETTCANLKRKNRDDDEQEITERVIWFSHFRTPEEWRAKHMMGTESKNGC